MTICKTCHGGCCRLYSIGITGYDILKISKALELDPSFFIELYEIIDEKQKKDIENCKALFKFTDNDCKNYYYFKMKKVKSLLTPDTWKCIFLQEWFVKPDDNSVENIVARCGIYSCRPYVCASFPAKFNAEGFCGRIPDMVKNQTKQDNPVYKLCSGKFTPEDFGNNTDSVMKNLVHEKYELDFFRSVAENWNKNPFSIQNFMFVLNTIYADRVFFENE